MLPTWWVKPDRLAIIKSLRKFGCAEPWKYKVPLLDLEYVINDNHEIKWYSERKYTARTLSLFRARVRQEVMVATAIRKQKRDAEVAEMSFAAAYHEIEWSKVPLLAHFTLAHYVCSHAHIYTCTRQHQSV